MLRSIPNIFVHLKADKQQEEQNKYLHMLHIKVLLITPPDKKKTPTFFIFALILPHAGKLQQRKYMFTLLSITHLQCKINGVGEST